MVMWANFKIWYSSLVGENAIFVKCNSLKVNGITHLVTKSTGVPHIDDMNTRFKHKFKLSSDI